MKKVRNAALCIALAIFAAGAVGQTAVNYPTRPVRLLIPFVPGGSTDFVARVMQARLNDELGQPVVIDNRPGAAGNIAVELTARAPADGYTVLFGNIGTIAINPALFRDFPVNTVRDLKCVSIVADVSSILVIHASVPGATVEDFVRYAKANPGKINYASSGAGSNGRLSMEYLMNRTGMELVHIAYKGAGGVASALLSGEAQASFVAIPSVVPHIKTGKLKGLAIVGPKRVVPLPDVPTMIELGFRELNVSSWQAIYLPAATPVPVAAKLLGAITKVMSDQKIIENLRTGGAEVINSASLEECASFTRQQVDFWAALVKQVGLAGKQ
jgi:tripartite-type tricarboxylate transporter receptor subunit TctC